MQEISSDVEDSYFLEESDGEESLDFQVLELEAKRAVREFSDDLSRQLTIEDETANRKEISTKPKITTKNIPDHLLPKVTIVGRPNVGKSAI